MKAAALDDVSTADVQANAARQQADAIAFRDANKLAVVDLDSLAQARQIRLEIARKKTAIKLELAKPKAWANGLHKWFCALESAAFRPLDELDAFEREQIVDFDRRMEQGRHERARVLAESQRVGLDARAIGEAAALEAAGETALAASVLHEALTAPAPVVVLADEVAAVQPFMTTWHWRLVDRALVPRDFLTEDTEKLDRYAVAMNVDARVPGIEFYSTKTPIRR